MNDSIFLKLRFAALAVSVAALPFSIAVCHLSLGVFLLLCLSEGSLRERATILLRNPLIWLPVAWFVLHLIGVVYSQNTANAWGNVEKKVTFILAPMIVGSAVALSKKDIERLAAVFVGACLVGTVICFVHAALTADASTPYWNFGPEKPFQDLHPDVSNLWPYFTYTGLASGIGIHPTYFAFYLLVCLLLLLEFGLNRRRINGTTAMVLIGYVVAVIILLSSRIVVLLSVATCAVYVFRSRNTPLHKWWLAAGLFVLVLGLLLLNPVATYRNTQEYTIENLQWPPRAMSDNPINIRVSLWWLASKAIPTVNPITGVGTGDVKDYMKAFADTFDVHNGLGTYDPHNQFAYTYLALGIPGLVVLLSIFAVVVWNLWTVHTWPGVVGMVGWMCVCLTESALESQKGIVLFSLFVALVGNQLRSSIPATAKIDHDIRNLGLWSK